MKINNKSYRTIWENQKGNIEVIDQRILPHQFEIMEVTSCKEMAFVISDMVIRGAGLIGASAAYGMALAAREGKLKDQPLEYIKEQADYLIATRPTAVNLAWAVKRILTVLENATESSYEDIAFEEARKISDEDAQYCKQIGEHGVSLIEAIYAKTQKTVNVLTHCNAGWLAFVDYGSATSPIYEAFNRGIPVHVWVDETRPRNQGASLTAWELGQHGVPHTVIADNTGGHLMQMGKVDMAIVGTDRTTRSGDVANKIGTYLKALAAKDNNIPFYVALPSSTIDWSIRDGIKEITIEERGEDEVHFISGLTQDGSVCKVKVTPPGSPGLNMGFDVTPARLITALITERGIFKADEESILEYYPEKKE
ncbi:MAG: S-methyl-5-thioribose-1-phosphate isomerase [Planctomycetes bacterium]|nr:S-methyl-5-thioribose-1-phosphate isomerase [Planctomycetota bacterium]